MEPSALRKGKSQLTGSFCVCSATNRNTDVQCVFCLQRVCEQLRLYPIGQPEEVPPTHITHSLQWSYMLSLTLCVCVCRSSTGRPDWTCVVIGFTSGYVRFYTEVGVSVQLRCHLDADQCEL